MKILATSIYSGAGQFTEAAIEGSGMISSCLLNCIFDTEPEESLSRFKKRIIKDRVRAIIMDSHFTPQGVTGISFAQLDFAREMMEKGKTVFFLLRSETTGFGCELWQFGKKMKFRDMENTVSYVVKIGSFGREYFYTKDSKPVPNSERNEIDHMLRNGHVFTERDWPSIRNSVEASMKSV